MITLLSPAKTLDTESRVPSRSYTQPRLLHESAELITVMRRKSPEELADLMGISDELAQLNAQRYADFELPFTRRNARPAIYTFAGDVYAGMDAPARFDGRDLTEAQKTIRILSGLYGVLRPLDLMQPYRLEMGSRIVTERGSSLYAWWGEQITTLLEQDLADSPGPAAIIDLASTEYSRSVDLAGIAERGVRVIAPRFEDRTPSGEWKVVSFSAKRARGMMAGWLVANRIRSIRALREFDEGGYAYAGELSTAQVPVFRREN